GEPGDGDSGDDTEEQLRVAASDTEVLRHRDFAELTAAERARLRELIAVLRPELPTRTSLRKRPAARGGLDPARTLRRMLAAGGEPVRLAYRQRVRGNRRVVLLIDVSGSMGPYADTLLRFAHVLTRRAPSHVEVFTLGTRLTRVTRALRRRDPEQAMLAAGRAVPDYAGGTRLGETLRVFLDRWGQRGLARGSVGVVFSEAGNGVTSGCSTSNWRARRGWRSGCCGWIRTRARTAMPRCSPGSRQRCRIWPDCSRGTVWQHCKGCWWRYVMHDVLDELYERVMAGETVGVGTVAATFSSAPRAPG